MVSKIILSIVLIVFFFPAFSKEYKINPSASSLQWEAKKVTGQHVGTIAFGEGTLKIEQGKIVGGKLSVDMNTIVDTDLTDSGFNQKLIGHLKSDDFFGVAKFPQSTLEVKKIEPKSDKLYHFYGRFNHQGNYGPGRI